MTVPGFGYYLALLVKAEIGDVNQLKSGDHLCSYAGLVPLYNIGGVTRQVVLRVRVAVGLSGLWLKPL